MDAEWASRGSQAQGGAFDCCIDGRTGELAQCGGEAVQVFGLAEYQHHGIEITGQEADAQHQTTSIMSVAWQSSSAPGSPPGTAIRRTFAHSSLTISSTSAVMPPTRRSLLPTETAESSITSVPARILRAHPRGGECSSKEDTQ